MSYMLIKYLQAKGIEFWDFPIFMKTDTIFFYGRDRVRIYVSNFLDRQWKVRIDDNTTRMSPAMAMNRIAQLV